MKKEKTELKKISEHNHDLLRLKTLSREELMAIVRIAESPEGKVMLKLMDGYVLNRMAEVFYNRDINPTSRLANATFDQGRGSGMVELRLLFRNARAELEKRKED